MLFRSESSTAAALSDAVAAALSAAASETRPAAAAPYSLPSHPPLDPSSSSSSKTASPVLGPAYIAASPCGSVGSDAPSSAREESWLMQLEEDESVRTELLDARELDVLMDSPTQDYELF